MNEKKNSNKRNREEKKKVIKICTSKSGLSLQSIVCLSELLQSLIFSELWNIRGDLLGRLHIVVNVLPER